MSSQIKPEEIQGFATASFRALDVHAPIDRSITSALDCSGKDQMREMSEGESCQQPSELTTGEASLIWDEYKYRHAHCWQTIFKLTSAAVLLGVIPYLDTKLPKEFRYWLLSPPVLAAALIGFGMLRMVRELSLLREVRSLQRERQGRLYGFHSNVRAGTFDKHVWWYLGVLIFLATVNIVIAAVHLFG